MAKQRKLSDAVKAFIVGQLACFDPPSAVAEAVKAEFGITITRQKVEAYNPNSRTGANLSDKWRQLFEETRKRFLEKSSEVPIANKSVRLRMLQRLIENAERVKNYGQMGQFIEQAAKESEGGYSNRREVSGPKGGPVPVQATVTIFALPDNGRG